MHANYFCGYYKKYIWKNKSRGFKEHFLMDSLIT